MSTRIQTGMLSPERLNEVKKIRQKISGMSLFYVNELLQSIRHDEQLVYDVFRRESDSHNIRQDLIRELFDSRAPENPLILETLQLLDLKGINLFDLTGGILNGKFVHLFFEVNSDPKHLKYPKVIEFLMGKMTTLNVDAFGMSLLSYLLKVEAYDFFRIAFRHGLDMEHRDEGGLCGHDYIDVTRNPNRLTSWVASNYNFYISESFLQEWNGLLLERELKNHGARPKVNRSL